MVVSGLIKINESSHLNYHMVVNVLNKAVFVIYSKYWLSRDNHVPLFILTSQLDNIKALDREGYSYQANTFFVQFIYNFCLLTSNVS